MSAKTDAVEKARVDYEGTGKAKEARVWLDLEAGLSEREFIEYMVGGTIVKNLCLCGCGEPTGRRSHRWLPGHNPAYGRPCLCGCGEPTVRGNQKWLSGHRENIKHSNISAERAMEIALGSPPRLRFQKPKKRRKESNERA